MNLLKNLKIIILVIAVLLILIIIRYADRNVFRENPETAVALTRDNSNLISLSRLRESGTSYLLIELGSELRYDSLHSIQMPFEKLLDKPNREILDQAKGKLILFSDDPGTAEKAWIILNQLGYKNLFILALEENPGELKYKFQSDTTARLEQDSM
jgi:hypothetical protein